MQLNILQFIFLLLGLFFPSYVASKQLNNITELQQRLTIVEKVLDKLLTGQPTGDISRYLNGTMKISEDIVTKGHPPVMFYTYRSGGVSGISTGFILKFDTVITNVGGHYYPNDGVFIAPVDGMYQFFWQYITASSNHGFTGLKVDGSWKGRSYTDSRPYDTSGNMVIVKMRAKQHAWIETHTSGMYIHAYSSFAGVLLNAV